MKYFFTLLLLITTPALAANYTIDKEASSIGFSGTHAGNDFTGVFEEWDATITFNAEDLTNSKITATFNTESAKTGDKLYDGTLPQGSWFDVKNHPKATFETTSITANEDGTYKAEGNLTIRDITKPISFNFSLEGESPTLAKTAFTINRLDFNIGNAADADGTWVSTDIGMSLNIVVSPE